MTWWAPSLWDTISIQIEGNTMRGPKRKGDGEVERAVEIDGEGERDRRG
jgi:hypothetical protein